MPPHVFSLEPDAEITSRRCYVACIGFRSGGGSTSSWRALFICHWLDKLLITSPRIFTSLPQVQVASSIPLRTGRAMSHARTARPATDALPQQGLGVWNSLPSNLRDEKLSFRSFRRLLKTHWFTADHSTIWTIIYCAIEIHLLTYLLTYILTTNKQHAVVSIQLNIVTCPTYPEKFIRDSVIALSLLLSTSSLSLYRCICIQDITSFPELLLSCVLIGQLGSNEYLTVDSTSLLYCPSGDDTDVGETRCGETRCHCVEAHVCITPGVMPALTPFLSGEEHCSVETAILRLCSILEHLSRRRLATHSTSSMFIRSFVYLFICSVSILIPLFRILVSFFVNFPSSFAFIFSIFEVCCVSYSSHALVAIGTVQIVVEDDGDDIYLLWTGCQKPTIMTASDVCIAAGQHFNLLV